MIRIYDSKQRKKVDLEPIEPGRISMYVCGPTVYNYIHVGNARTFMSFDVIRRYLTWKGFEVDFVQNITDVDDKIIARAIEEGREASEVAQDYTQAFIDDMHAVNVIDPTVRPKATEEIHTMIALITKLIERDHAYATDDGDVYFSVRSFPGYGALSGRNIDEMEAGHRDLRTEGIEDRKQDALDFALWKAAKPGEPAWDSPWGKGRPGWHIECSCMSEKYLGLPFDIHGGGADLCFPHHENERAQSEAATGERFANHWMHGGMLQIDSEKMSKSLGNFMLLRDVLEEVDPAVLRFLMLQTHYRSPLDYSPARLEEATTALERIKNSLATFAWAASHGEGSADAIDADLFQRSMNQLRTQFEESMDDDFNCPRAIGAIFEFLTDANGLVSGKQLSEDDAALVSEARALIIELLAVLGIPEDTFEDASDSQAYPQEVIAIAKELAGYVGDDTAEAVQALLDARAEARAAKDWAVADSIRDSVASIGFAIMDTPQGARLEAIDA